jgi:hypothetical protein
LPSYLLCAEFDGLFLFYCFLKHYEILLLLITMKSCEEITFGMIVTGLVGGHGFSEVVAVVGGMVGQ